jgi:hypothetical protein
MPYQRGEARPAAKLTEAQVREIRALHSTPCKCCGRSATLAEIGRQYGCSAVNIHSIVRGESWKHVGEDA